MKKSAKAISLIVTLLFIFTSTISAQEQNFDGLNIGDTFNGIGWAPEDVAAVVADDPVTSGNNVLQCTINNYNAAPVLEFTLPEGKTLADYTSFTYKAYFAQGDVGWKDIVVEAYQEMPTAQAFTDAAAKIGSWNRAMGGSTEWEDITIDITNTSSISGTFYIAFGINCAGTGDIGGSGVATMWYADDIKLVGSDSPVDGSVVLFDEFDDGDGLWSSGWIDGATTDVTVSIDTTGKLSGANSYKIEVTNGGVEMWRIQRVAALPLTARKKYHLSFMAVASQEAAINVLFEIAGDPYTKRLDDTVTVTTTPQTFNLSMAASEDVADNMVKLMFGSQGNNGATIWIDKIIVTETENTDLISLWGLSGEYNTIWPILNDDTTPPGDASMGGDVVSGWKGLQGGFSELDITNEKALVVKGKIQFLGADAGDAYTPIRYAITYQDSNSTLVNALTDSATWSHTGNHFGYGFHPRTGNGTMSNGNGGTGTVWTINNGNWASTWSNNGGPIAAENQAPRNAQIIAGTYNFAISVQSVDDTTNEIKWYMIEENNQYWFGGSVIDTAVTKKFNSVIFGVNEVEWSQVNVMEMTAELGDPISVPEAPWQSYYIDQWGLSGEYNTIWPILNDSTTLVGDASMGGEVVSGWKGLQGGFGQDVTISTDNAIIVEGQIEFVGADAGDAYTPIRYALTYQDSNSTLVNALTDTATWSHTGNHFGYGFHPRTGNGTVSNGNGGSGNVWTINNGNWASTWSNNGLPIGTANQAPRNAQIIAGTYDFAISVRSIDEFTNEIKWYMIEENNQYWFGGTIIDTATTKKFNSIIFGVNEVEWSQFNVIAMKVDKGNPIDVPEPPWQSYYVDQWGLSGEYNTIWPILNDSTTLIGDASMGGEFVSGWKGLQGGFGDVSISTDKALILEGQIEFVGADAGDAYTPLRYALTYQDSNSTLVNALTDSATWSHTGNHFGYGFHPRTGNGTMSNGNGGAGTVWTINDGNWASTWSNNGGPISDVTQIPRNAQIIAGTYDFGISVRSIDEYTNEIKWYLIEENKLYWWGGTVIDTATTKKFNSIIFGVNEVEWTEVNVIAMKVDKGDPIDIPDAPFAPFYVGEWGFTGGRTGSWSLTPGEFTGNVTVSGDGPAGDWAAISGAFENPVSPTAELALEVKGKMVLTGGGFEDWSSLRLGLFNMTDPGTLDTLESGLSWNGTEEANGYLILPHSGTNDIPTWNGVEGTAGAINGTTWLSTNGEGSVVLSTNVQKPAGAVGSAGEYEFYLYVIDHESGAREIRYIIEKDADYSFMGTLIDEAPVTDVYNSINFALNSSTATAMDLLDVHVDQIALEDVPVGVEADERPAVPTAYALDQNYPNPFNPTTMIEFALPKTGEVHLKVYDILGRVVTELISDNLSAGYHKIEFNASNLASGIYFYSLKAGDFVAVKKLMLIK